MHATLNHADSAERLHTKRHHLHQKKEEKKTHNTTELAVVAKANGGVRLTVNYKNLERDECDTEFCP